MDSHVAQDNFSYKCLHALAEFAAVGNRNFAFSSSILYRCSICKCCTARVAYTSVSPSAYSRRYQLISLLWNGARKKILEMEKIVSM